MKKEILLITIEIKRLIICTPYIFVLNVESIGIALLCECVTIMECILCVCMPIINVMFCIISFFDRKRNYLEIDCTNTKQLLDHYHPSSIPLSIILL